MLFTTWTIRKLQLAALSVAAVYALVLTSGCSAGGAKSAAVSAPGSPGSLTVTTSEGRNILTWPTITGASSYTAYYSTTAGVTPATGIAIPSVTPGFSHTGIVEGTTYYYTVVANNVGGSSSPSPVASATVAAVSGTNDPFAYAQWFIANTGQMGGTVGADMRLTTMTATSNFGQGVRVAIVDDGLEIGHQDLWINTATNLSYNYLTGSSDPTGSGSDASHGTAVGGIIAARDSNALGVRGIASRANIVGYNYLQRTTTANEADAMVRNISDIWVSNNSWGPTDCTGQVVASSSTWKAAVDYGVTNGRNGLGTVYVWAAGNGNNDIASPVLGQCGISTAFEVDNSNYDGYANYNKVIAVCGVSDTNGAVAYSEKGANLWVCGRTLRWGVNGNGVFTTDLTGTAGYNSDGSFNYSSLTSSTSAYTNYFSGTSAAAPMVAATSALILKARPSLSWRDVRYALARTATSISGGDWTQNSAGRWVNHSFGFGAVDSDAAVAYATAMTPLGSQVTYDSGTVTVNQSIPDNSVAGVANTLAVTGSGINQIEFVEVTFTAANHTEAGDLRVQLIRQGTPSTTSDLAVPRQCRSGSSSAVCSSFNGWIFGSARHLDESADANWVLRVEDAAAGDTGTFQSWRLRIFGR